LPLIAIQLDECHMNGRSWPPNFAEIVGRKGIQT
jgi:hypothetical protein